MTPNAMNALKALGVEEAALAVAFEPESQVLRSWRSGRVIYRAPVRRVFRETFGAPLWLEAGPARRQMIELGVAEEHYRAAEAAA